jgi:hypothetical protein
VPFALQSWQESRIPSWFVSRDGLLARSHSSGKPFRSQSVDLPEVISQASSLPFPLQSNVATSHSSGRPLALQSVEVPETISQKSTAHPEPQVIIREGRPLHRKNPRPARTPLPS